MSHDDRAPWNRAVEHQRAGRLGEARDAYMHLIRESDDPREVAEAVVNLGVTLEQEGRHVDASRCYHWASKQPATEAVAALNLGDLLARNGGMAEAEPLLERALQATQRPESNDSALHELAPQIAARLAIVRSHFGSDTSRDGLGDALGATTPEALTAVANQLETEGRRREAHQASSWARSNTSQGRVGGAADRSEQVSSYDPRGGEHAPSNTHLEKLESEVERLHAQRERLLRVSESTRVTAAEAKQRTAQHAQHVEEQARRTTQAGKEFARHQVGSGTRETFAALHARSHHHEDIRAAMSLNPVRDAYRNAAWHTPRNQFLPPRPGAPAPLIPRNDPVAPYLSARTAHSTDWQTEFFRKYC
jgi:hypothetical protein